MQFLPSVTIRNLVRSAGRIAWRWSRQWQVAVYRHLMRLPLAHCAREVARHLARMARWGRLCQSAREIAAEIGYCQKQVERAIKELNDAGVLGWDRTWRRWPKSMRGKRYGPNEYTFMPSVCRLAEGSDMVSEQTLSFTRNNKPLKMKSAYEGRKGQNWQSQVDRDSVQAEIAVLRRRFSE